MKINTEQAYLFGLLVGGGILHNDTLQIVLPYKNWGDLKINPTRAGGIAEDILSRLNQLLVAHYGMNISYKVGTDWKILSNSISEKLKKDLALMGLPIAGELRDIANLSVLIPSLRSLEHKKNFITGLIDTIGSLASSHRRFVSDFQIISFEFKGSNFDLVGDVIRILQEIDCVPDQVLWNHPNQHSGTDRYYKSWKKGFKVRVALNDYFLKGGFVFRSKQLSAQENLTLQTAGTKTSKGKPIKVSGRVALHIDESNAWLPPNVRGGHYIHNLHFNSVLGIQVPDSFNIKGYINGFEKFFCPFTCLTKGDITYIKDIISKESYLVSTAYKFSNIKIKDLLEAYSKDTSLLVFGRTTFDGFPISYILQGVAYIIAATAGDGIKGKRVLGNYIDLIEKHLHLAKQIKIGLPDRGTCIYIKNNEFAALVGYVNDQFNKKLITKIDDKKVYIREPLFKECIKL